MKKLPLSVIIPVYNEERTISSIVEIVGSWGRAKEIIVVDDASKDNTLDLLKQFKGKIKVIRNRTNMGKSYALKKGIEAACCNNLMFLDGDIIGLTFSNLDDIINPFFRHKADMVLGIPKLWSLNWPGGSFEPYNDITGIRILAKDQVDGVISDLDHLGYGVEIYLNNHFKNKRVLKIKLKYLHVLSKMDKQKLIPDAAISYIKEAKDMVVQLTKQQADEISPRAKIILNKSIYYLKKARDYLEIPI